MGVWQTLQGELAVATGNEFERRVLPLMRFLHADMIRAPERAGLDRAGIDILGWVGGDRPIHPHWHRPRGGNEGKCRRPREHRV